MSQIVNPPRQIVPPYGKEDIKSIVQDAITNGDIALPTVEAGTKLYLHNIHYDSTRQVKIISPKSTLYAKDDFKVSNNTDGYALIDKMIVINEANNNYSHLYLQYNGSYFVIGIEKIDFSPTPTITITTVNLYDEYESDTVTEL